MRDLPASRETSSEMATWSLVRVTERFSTSVWHELPVRGGLSWRGLSTITVTDCHCRPPRRASLYMTKKGLQRGDHEHLRTPHLATLLIHVNVYHHFCLEGIPVHRTLHSLPRPPSRPPTLQPSAFSIFRQVPCQITGVYRLCCSERGPGRIKWRRDWTRVAKEHGILSLGSKMVYFLKYLIEPLNIPRR